MSVNIGAKPVRAELYLQIAAIVQDPGATPLPKALSLIKTCLEAGECLLASNACEQLAKQTPDDPQLMQLWALALARSGAASKANAMMKKLAERGLVDEKTLGLLARTCKDLWLQTGDRKLLAEARDTYLKANRLSGGAWSGINAATLALVSGEEAQCMDLANKVLQALDPLMQEFAADSANQATRERSPTGLNASTSAQAGQSPPSNGSQAYWDYATIGEAALILGRHDLASWAYTKAVHLSEGQLGNRASSLRNAELVLSARGAARKFVEEHFPAPQVVVFSGHMLDAPDREGVRFHPAAEKAVSERLLRTLSAWETQIGFSSAAGGADILFLEALKQLGAETNIVLPHPPEMFIRTSAAQSNGVRWITRFEKVLSEARHVTVLSDFVGDEIGYHFSSIVMTGLAKLRGSQVCGDLRALTVWDLKPGAVGGTASTVSEWLDRGIRVAQISPAISDDQLTILEASHRIGSAEKRLKSSRQKIISMLFADAVGFSKLAEEQIPAFVERFLGGVRAVMDSQQHAALSYNTWGDGLYFTFDSVAHANDFALDLSELVNGMIWKDYGLPAELNLRIALHAGRAFEILDPVTRQRGFTGTHVSRAARIEPVTPPGYVYCSEAHAALVALENDDSYACEFVGNMSYAKNYGVFPMYSLKRRRNIGAA